MIKEKFIILFGTKYLGQRTAKLLEENGYHDYCFTTSMPKDWYSDNTVGEVPILPFKTALEFHPDALIVVCAYNYSTGLEYCKHHSENSISFIEFYDRYPDIFLPFMNLEKKRGVINFEKIRFADSESSRVFYEQVAFQSTHFEGYKPRPQSEEHFSYPMILNDHENFVDCGAFTGDTIQKFLDVVGDNFQSITAIEPNDYEFPEYVKVHNVVLGSQPGETKFSFSKSDYDKVGEGDTVKVETLDRLLDPSKEYFIKMDIEGSELEALKGATELLKAGKSKWSICLYHKASDLFTIPDFIHKTNPDYKLYLRRYAEWSSDIVLYVMP